MPSPTMERIQTVWPVIAGVLWGAAGVLGICAAVTVVAFFDKPSPSPSANTLFIFSMISFPIVCILSSLGIWILRKKNKILTGLLSLLPVFPLLLIFAGGAWMNVASCGRIDCSVPTLQQQIGSAEGIGTCTAPIPDGGDGLATSGCGTLTFGVEATGTTGSTVEAQNWAFSAPDAGPLQISIASSGVCPQIRILDSRDQVVEGFEEQNRATVCMGGGLTETSFYYFDPPGEGNYVIRLVTPDTPGAYVLKIEPRQ